jgi:hypothetical protein
MILPINNLLKSFSFYNIRMYSIAKKTQINNCKLTKNAF